MHPADDAGARACAVADDAVGKWTKVNSESVDGTQGSPFAYELEWGLHHQTDWPSNGTPKHSWTPQRWP